MKDDIIKTIESRINDILEGQYKESQFTRDEKTLLINSLERTVFEKGELLISSVEINE